MTHRRNTEGMHTAPRCGARTRNGAPCRAPRVRERKRCRMHGGARGSGARFGNRNALKHGNYSRAERLRLRAVRALIRESEAMLTAAGEPRPAARKDGG